MAPILILRGRIAMATVKCSLGMPTFTFSVSHSAFHKEKKRPFSPKPWIDFTRINQVDDAIILFREMLRMRPKRSVVEFTALLNVVVKMKHYSVVLSMFDEMRQLGAPVDRITMNIAINCYCLSNRVDFGLSIMGGFFKCGYEPNVVAFTTLIKGLFLVDKVAEAEKMFKKLLALKICEPNEFMIFTVINGVCKAGQTLTACELLGLFEKTSYKPTVYSYSTVIDSLSKDKMIDHALQLLSRMIDRGIPPNVVTYNSVIRGLCYFGTWKDVKNILREMVDHKISPNVITYNILVDAFCKEGSLKRLSIF